MSTQRRPPVALTVAGSDSGGGAGVQADLKTFHRFGVYGVSAITLITAQNTRETPCVHRLPPELVGAQIDAVCRDFAIDAAKSGALGSAQIVEQLADAAARYQIETLVVDPVLTTTTGSPLLSEPGLESLRKHLMPRAALVTPNLAEATALTGIEVTDEQSMRAAARDLVALGAKAVLLTGGHLPGPLSVDWLYEGGTLVRLDAPRVHTPHTHGTGCTYSAAIAAHLARGESLSDAVRAAKAFITRALQCAPGLGGGHGPVNHWA